MIKKLLILLLTLICVTPLDAQQGLEQLIVEKYYVTNTTDTIGSSYFGKIPVGSTTYRIFVDLLPNYTFQAAYGSPDHVLFLKTTTAFFNHTSTGHAFPNIIPRRTLSNTTVMLDSWLSVGAAGEGSYGVLKSEDDTVETIQHYPPYLQNNLGKTTLSLAKRDGLKSADNLPRPTFYGIDTAVLVFENKTGSIFTTSNGAWACLGKGSKGVDSLGSNKVLIAQITTDGEFEFELNIQIGTPEGTSENYVARNPVNNEIALPTLIFKSDQNRNNKRTKRNKRKS